MRGFRLASVLAVCGCVATYSLRAGDPTECDPHGPRSPHPPSSVWTPDVQTFAKHLDDLHNQAEEWGTVSLSSLVLAPPETTVNVMVPSHNPDGSVVKDGSTTLMEPAQKYLRDGKGNLILDKSTGKYLQEPLTTKAGTFEFKLQKPGSDFFDLAGYGEGTVQNSSRTFQQFAGSANVQFYPDEAASVSNQRREFLRQQVVSDQVENANLKLFQANVATAQQSQQFGVSTAQTNVDEANQTLQKARLQQTKAQSAANLAQLDLQRATDELTEAQARQDQATAKASVPGVPTPSPDDTAKLASAIIKAKSAQAIAQTAATNANADLSTANTNLTAATQAQTTAQSQLAAAMAAPLSLPSTAGLPAGTSQTTAGNSYPGVAAPASTPAPSSGFANAAPPAAAPTDLNFGNSALANTLLPSGTAAFPARSRVIDAASSKVTQEILNFLASPTTAAAFRDKTVMFAVGDISVNPGWRTKRDYAADIDISFSYEWKEAHAETIKRLVRSSYYTLTLRQQIAQSYSHLMEAEDWDFLDLQEEQHRRLVRALTRAEKDLDAVHQFVAMAEGELLTATNTLLYQARLASKTPANEAQDRLQDAVKAFDAANDRVGKAQRALNDAGKSKKGLPRYALEKALEDRDIAAAEVIAAAKALAERPVDKPAIAQRPTDSAVVPPPPSAAAGATPGPLPASPTSTVPATLAPAVPILAITGDLTYRDLDKTAKDAEKKIDALKTARTAADKAEKGRADALANKRGSAFEQSNQVVYDHLPSKNAADPLVAAVSPMTDNQNLDESSSIARQDDIALFLSVTLAKAGLREQASAYERYVKQRRQDVATRSAIATANSYTLGGNHVGFQIGPRLRALAQPANRGSAPAQTLDRQTFPALFLVAVTADDLRPVLQRVSGGGVKVCERALSTRFSHRWYRTDHVFWPPWHNKRQALPSEKLAREARLEDFVNYLHQVKPAESTVYNEAAHQYETLLYSYTGATTTQRIPGYFLVPDRIVQADPVATDTTPANPSPTPKPVVDILPVISSVTAPPAKGTGTAANPFAFTGKAPTSVSPASFSVLIQGKNLDALDLSGAVCAPISGSGGIIPGIHTVSVPTAIGTEGISVTLETTSAGGTFTILFPVKSDKDHADVSKLMTQVPSGSLTYSYTQ